MTWGVTTETGTFAPMLHPEKYHHKITPPYFHGPNGIVERLWHGACRADCHLRCEAKQLALQPTSRTAYAIRRIDEGINALRGPARH